MFKPFKAPSFVKRPAKIPDDHEADIKPFKRQRTDKESHRLNVRHPSGNSNGGDVGHAAGTSATVRQPLEANNNLPNVASLSPERNLDDEFYNVLWRKPTVKKHKTWDGDGVLRVSDGVAHLYDLAGKLLGKGTSTGPFLPGSMLKAAGREVEVDSLLSREEFAAMQPWAAQRRLADSQKLPPESSRGESGQKLSRTKASLKPDSSRDRKNMSRGTIQLGDSRTQATVSSQQIRKANGISTVPSDAVRPRASQTMWKNPLKDDTVQAQTNDIEPTPRHDARAPEALVMRRPPACDVPKGRRVVDVVVDPILSKKLRPHQCQGVKFLYECVMGMRSRLGQGAILADDMGLGKTLQTIALIWTLLKQNPIYGDDPIIKKVLIVCPVTLTRNWRKEFRKWLGSEKIGVFVAGDKNTRISDFTRGRSYSVMIIGYERLRSVAEDLQKGLNIDLIVADEGHRLKTTQSKLAQAIQTLETPRRIILSGTPIQNDLGEFFSMVDFVNPGALGTLKAFTKNFENPIEKSRQPGALEKDLEKGEARSEELAETTKTFILRRTADILAQYLPAKVEHVLLCRPTAAQATVYKQVLASPVFQSAMNSAENALQLITILRKVCNSPRLLAIDPSVDVERATIAPAVASSISPGLLRNASASSKLRVLDQLLHTIHEQTEEKVVIISNFTSTLDLLEGLLTSLSMPFLRLDGSTPASKRQDLVDTFNRTDRSMCFAFLLSAKAGGLGLNLIGASRLVLFDVDWNPAVDAQAMARIHRDGQKRQCHIYRLLLAGALDEKIWQRQVTKLGLANSVLESKSDQASFTREELKDLFRLDESPGCQTHELIGCPCKGRRLVEDDASPVKDPAVSPEPIENTPGSEHAPIDLGADVDDTDSDLDLTPFRKRQARPSARDSMEPRVMKASEVDMETMERERHRGLMNKHGSDVGTQASVESLMAYSHVSIRETNREDELETLTEDDVLAAVLSDEDNLVNFVFSKTTK